MLTPMQEKARQMAARTIAKARENGDIVLETTIGDVTHRNNGWIRARIENSGFSAIVGMPYECIKVEKGSKVIVTGTINDRYAMRSLDFNPSGLMLADRPYCNDPKLRAVQRACKSFTANKVDTLQWEFGERWIEIILNDPWITERGKRQRIG